MNNKKDCRPNRSVKSIGMRIVICILTFCSICVAESAKQDQGTFSMVPLICIVSTILVYSLILFIWFKIRGKFADKSTKDLIACGEKLVSKDVNNLSLGITEISQGNLAKRLYFDALPITASVKPEFATLKTIFNNLIENLQEAVSAYNTVTDIPCKHLYYIGADSFLEGRKCGEMMGTYLNGQGDIVIMGETFATSNLDLRRRGFLSTLREKFPQINVLDTFEATSDAMEVAAKAIHKYPQMKGFYVADGGTPQLIAQAVEKANKAGKIRIITHDLMDGTMSYLQKGVVTATLSQDSYAQGYNPVIHMFNFLNKKWKPVMPNLLTELDVISSENFTQYWHEKKGLLLSDAVRERLAKPIHVEHATERRIAVLGRDDNPFWLAIKEAFDDAKAALKNEKVVVDWYVPETIGSVQDLTADNIGAAIEKIIEGKYDGLLTLAPDRALVPYINMAVDMGIPVGIYNSDPTSLRGFIYTITQVAQKLMTVSENLSQNSHQMDAITKDIDKAIDDITNRTKKQNDHVSGTQRELIGLLDTINQVSSDTDQSAASVVETSNAVKTSTGAMNDTLDIMKGIESSVIETWELVEKLGKHSQRIDSIVELINDIAGSVNVLALNASITASKAGEYGKGFMVIANEVRNLAKNTADATGEVAELIKTVQEDIAKIEEVMSKGLKNVRHSTELTGSAQTALNETQLLIETDKKRIHDIAQAMTNMHEVSKRVGNSMTQVDSISKENLMIVEKIHSSTSNMTMQLEMVMKLINKVDMMAKGEQNMLAKFILLED